MSFHSSFPLARDQQLVTIDESSCEFFHCLYLIAFLPLLFPLSLPLPTFMLKWNVKIEVGVDSHEII